MEEHRYPLSARILGIMFKAGRKLYITSVLWSDQNEVTVFRSLRDFKRLHRQLKKKYPVEKPFRNQDRVLPSFGGLVMKLNLQWKSPTWCIYRVKVLDRYCTELLKSEPSISQSSDLINFFLQKEEELHPEFAHNSIIIFVPEETTNGQPKVNLGSEAFSVGNVSQPTVTKLYRCSAAYETKDTKNRPFSVTLGENVEVLIKDPAGWWLVENEEKCLAWFPAPYLELCDDEEQDGLDSADSQTLYCAKKSYTSNKNDELSVNIGAVMEVIQKSEDGWWLVRYKGKTGYVPSIYLQPYNNPVFNMQKRLYSSNLNLATSSTLQSRPTHKPCFQKSRSVEVYSEPVQSNESNSYRSSFSDDTDIRSSSSVSLVMSQHSSEGADNLRQSVNDANSDSPDSSLDMEVQNLTNLEKDSPSKLYPKVPPRPQTQDILNRCTTYTRKAALETQARLFHRIDLSSL